MNQKRGADKNSQSVLAGQPIGSRMTEVIIDDMKSVLRDVLQLGDSVLQFDASTPLFGSLPELDSMAVVTLVGALEDRFDFTVEDDEITAEVFETVGSLTDFVKQKLAS